MHAHDYLDDQALTDLRSLRWMWEEEVERREREASSAPASAPSDVDTPPLAQP